MASVPTDLPNPNTPLAWLPPGDAAQLTVAQFVVVGILSVWLWDAMLSLPEEWQMVKKYGIRPPDIVITTGLFLFVTLISFAVIPVDPQHCHAVGKLLGWAGSMQYLVNAFLFLFRIRAVFVHQPMVLYFFYVMFVTIVVSSFAAAFSVDSFPLAHLNYCAHTRVKAYGAICIVISAVYDTLVFGFITVKLLLNNRGPWMSSWRMFFTGKKMGRISRAVLQSGQLYFMVTAGFTILAAAMVMSPSVSTIVGDTAIKVNVFMTNTMATRVYRHLKLGVEPHPSLRPSNITTMVFRENSTVKRSEGIEVHMHKPSSTPSSSPYDSDYGNLPS